MQENALQLGKVANIMQSYLHEQLLATHIIGKNVNSLDILSQVNQGARAYLELTHPAIRDLTGRYKNAMIATKNIVS